MNRAGEWLFDSVKTEWINAILSTCRPSSGKISETILPDSPRGVNRNGDFIKRPDLVLEESGRVLERRVELAHRLAVPALEGRLVLPGVDLAGTAVGEDPDDAFGPGREVRRPRGHRVERDSAAVLRRRAGPRLEQAGQPDQPESAAGTLQATSRRVRHACGSGRPIAGGSSSRPLVESAHGI